MTHMCKKLKALLYQSSSFHPVFPLSSFALFLPLVYSSEPRQRMIRIYTDSDDVCMYICMYILGKLRGGREGVLGWVKQDAWVALTDTRTPLLVHEVVALYTNPLSLPGTQTHVLKDALCRLWTTPASSLISILQLHTHTRIYIHMYV